MTDNRTVEEIPRYVLTSGALVECHDAFTGKPAGDFVKHSDMLSAIERTRQETARRCVELAKLHIFGEFVASRVASAIESEFNLRTPATPGDTPQRG
jgi:hypothetical protein